MKRLHMGLLWMVGGLVACSGAPNPKPDSIIFSHHLHSEQGLECDVPSGNVDILPTICHILGIVPSGERDGRVLREALVDGPKPEDVTVERQIHRASAKTGGGWFEQESRVSRVDGTAYLDQATARHA